MSKVIEICCFSIHSVINAQKYNVKRIELCDNIYENGTTPSIGMIKKAREIFKNNLNVIVRPRGGNFVYSDEEFKIIKEDIKYLKDLKVNGIVVGILKKDNEVDIVRMREIVNLAKPLSITFHKAFDITKDPYRSLENLISLNVDRILTSGQSKTALQGAKLISELIIRANNRIIIMPGGNINANNLIEILKITNANEFHSSAKSLIKNKTDNSSFYIADLSKISKMQEILKI